MQRGLSEVMKNYPLRILFWETTTACNLGCVHCRRLEAVKRPADDELSTAEAKKLLGEFIDWCSPLVVLSGGEPLERGDIVELAALASGSGLRVALATNGTLVTGRIATELRRAGVCRVSVSLDGARPGTHDRLRGVRGAFDSALKGLRTLKAAGLSTQINVTVCKGNREEIEELFILAEHEGVDAVHLFLFVPVGCGLAYGEEYSLTPGEVEDLMDWFYRKAFRGGIESRLTCAPQFQRLLAEKGEDIVGRVSGCLAGRSVCFISHSGDVFPCGYLPVSAGNVRQMSLREIWGNSELFLTLRNPDNFAAPCGICAYRNICGGCRARAYSATGDYLAGDGSCLNPKLIRG